MDYSKANRDFDAALTEYGGNPDESSAPTRVPAATGYAYTGDCRYQINGTDSGWRVLTSENGHGAGFATAEAARMAISRARRNLERALDEWAPASAHLDIDWQDVFPAYEVPRLIGWRWEVKGSYEDKTDISYFVQGGGQPSEVIRSTEDMARLVTGALNVLRVPDGSLTLTPLDEASDEQRWLFTHGLGNSGVDYYVRSNMEAGTGHATAVTGTLKFRDMDDREWPTVDNYEKLNEHPARPIFERAAASQFWLQRKADIPDGIHVKQSTLEQAITQTFLVVSKTEQMRFTRAIIANPNAPDTEQNDVVEPVQDQEPIVQTCTLTLTIPAGEKVSTVAEVTGQGVTGFSASQGVATLQARAGAYDGDKDSGTFTQTTVSLLPVEVEEVFERDQRWNKAPSPKHWVKPTPAKNGYDDDQKEGSTILTRTLFVAVEPGSGKVELDVKGAGGSSGTMQTLVGLKSHSGTMLNDVATMSGGVAHLNFTPAHGINEGRHELCIGLDKNSNGKLDADEVVEFPQDKKFWIRAVTASDYTSNFNHVDWRETQAYFGGLSFTASVLQCFLAMDSTLDEATSTTTVTVPITRRDLTHIAGSKYDPSSGNTTIDRFHLPDGSTATLAIESTLDIEHSQGLRGVLDQTWVHYRAQFEQHLAANPQLQTWSSGPVQIKPTNGSINCSGGAGIPDDLAYSIGTAGITGTMNFTIERNPSDSTKFYLKQLDIDCVVEDLIDYDWTRGPSSESRPASIVQIGWQPPARNGGRVFFVSIKVVESYDLSKLGKFNAAPGSGTTPPTGGPQ